MGLPYFPMFPADFEADTSHLSMLEDGAYNRLLRICWMTPGCTIPADEGWIFRRLRARTDDEIAAVRAILAEFFTQYEGRFSNARLTREWLAAKEAHERRVSAGRKGGKTKSLKKNETAPSNAKAKPKQPEPEPEPYSVTNVTGGEPPDPQKVMFDSGVALLCAAGTPDRQARSLLGKWRKAHGVEAVIAAIGKAQREGAVDPAAFIQGCFRHQARSAQPRAGDIRKGKSGVTEEYLGSVEGWVEVHA